MASAQLSPEDLAAMRANPKKPLMVVFLTIFIDLMGFSIIFPLFPAMLDFYLPLEDPHGRLLARFAYFLTDFVAGGANSNSHFIMSVLFGGILGSVFSALQFVFAPIWGKLSDRLGRRPLLIFTIGATTLSYIIWIFANTFWVFLVTRILAGIMAGNISIASAAVADITGKQHRTKSMALVGVAFSLGFMLGPAIGGLLAHVDLVTTHPVWFRMGMHPFSAVALCASCLSLVNWVWVIKHFPETLSHEKERHWIRAIRFPSVFKLFRVSVIPIRRANLINFLFILALSGMEFTLVFFAVERFNYTPAQNGLMFVYLGIILLLAQGVLVRRLVAFVPEVRMMSIGIICGIIAYLIVAFSNAIFIFYIGIAFIALSSGLITPTIASLVSLYANEQEQGRYLGSLRSAGALARAFGPFLAALVYFVTNSTVCYLFGAALMLLPLRLLKELPQPAKK